MLHMRLASHSRPKADGETVAVGGTYLNAQAATHLRNRVNNQVVLSGESDGEGTALLGQSVSGWGVNGVSPSGAGLRGGTTSGIGVFAESGANGYAVFAKGRLRIEHVSGVVIIPAGSRAAIIEPPVNVSGNAFVLLTPQAGLGGRSLWAVVDGGQRPHRGSTLEFPNERTSRRVDAHRRRVAGDRLIYRSADD